MIHETKMRKTQEIMNSWINIQTAEFRYLSWTVRLSVESISGIITAPSTAHCQQRKSQKFELCFNSITFIDRFIKDTIILLPLVEFKNVCETDSWSGKQDMMQGAVVVTIKQLGGDYGLQKLFEYAHQNFKQGTTNFFNSESQFF